MSSKQRPKITSISKQAIARFARHWTHQTRPTKTLARSMVTITYGNSKYIYTCFPNDIQRALPGTKGKPVISRGHNASFVSIGATWYLGFWKRPSCAAVATKMITADVKLVLVDITSRPKAKYSQGHKPSPVFTASNAATASQYRLISLQYILRTTRTDCSCKTNATRSVTNSTHRAGFSSGRNFISTPKTQHVMPCSTSSSTGNRNQGGKCLWPSISWMTSS
mmetsp:Transcript_16797/g.40501  ORF Transcript_16797/g.40501 Transcript_16797/m.40501 type:complete len:223 (+) Transcript_16797:805-1473(+)